MVSKFRKAICTAFAPWSKMVKMAMTLERSIFLKFANVPHRKLRDSSPHHYQCNSERFPGDLGSSRVSDAAISVKNGLENKKMMGGKAEDYIVEI